MAEWFADHLAKIQQNDELFVAPFRDDGTTYGTPTQTWALVVDGKVYLPAGSAQLSAGTRPPSAKAQEGCGSRAPSTTSPSNRPATTMTQ